MKYFLHRDQNHSFFSRMLLICTALLTLFSIIVSIIVSHLSGKYEESQYLKSYELAMVNLSEAFYERFADFYLLAGKVLTDNQCDPNLLQLLQASSYEEVSAATRSNSIRLLSDICRDDRYLRGFFLCSLSTGQLYYYTDSSASLSHTSSLPEIGALQPFSASKIDQETVNKMLLACTNSGQNTNRFYGITATLYKNPANPLGYLIPLFSVAEFENILTNFDLDSQNTFIIQDFNGNVFFNSNPSLEPDTKAYYTKNIKNKQYGFQVTYYVSKLSLPQSTLTYMIIAFAALVTFFSFSLYYITYYLSHRNIKGILDGMKQFSLNDLTYRLNRPKGRNEFTQIIEGFNIMCDELQRNVERSYVYELQQKKAELYALQTSINPHFLYNTLEIIRNQVTAGSSSDASQMILLLSKIYRGQTNTNMFVSLSQEAELCENLMILYQYRFQNFEYDFDVAGDAGQYALPKNTLQPLIENYFVHGIATERQDNFFQLTATTEIMEGTRYIHLRLCNNGNPIDPKRIACIEGKLRQNIYANQESMGFALTNIYNRLRIVFQDRCHMEIRSGSGDMRFQMDLTFAAMTADELHSSFV